jgi:dipeptidyl aminopeptidase/acylaminoacyl peptidase
MRLSSRGSLSRPIVRPLRAATLGLALVAFVALAAPAQGAFPGANGKITFDRDSDIFTMNADGGGQTNVTASAAVDFAPAWSPDGARIAFVSNQDPASNEIYLVNADGTGQVRLTVNSFDDRDPAWSPDGTKIAFTTTRDGNGEIYVMNANGSGQTNLTNNPANDKQPAWSPDGTKIAFTSARGGTDQVYVMNANGSSQVNLSNSGAPDSEPNWSPDASMIAYTSFRNNFEVFTMNADGSGQANRTTGSSADVGPTWSPDGSKIAFASDRSGNFEIFAMSANGSGAADLTNNAAQDVEPDWQPILQPGNNPPSCSAVTATPSVLSSADGLFHLVTLGGATDPDGDTVILTVVAVTQDEPLTGKGDTTTPDATRASQPNQVFVRAERSQRGDGRVYRIAFTASDARGGNCRGTAAVGVPRQKNRAAVDSAPPSYNSFGPLL